MLPVLAAQEVGGVAPDLVLQPGSVVSAQVVKVLSADLVRIAIASLSIDVMSEIPLQEGQTLQLAVSQTKDGIRLALVGQGSDAAGASADAVTLSPEALIDVPANAPTIVAPKNVLTPVERAAVSVAAQTAATEQDSLAPLFANLGAVVSTGSLPPKLQQAIAQVLAQQTSLDPNLDGGDIKTAFQKSGIFLEASLAAGSVPSSGVPDLKAALIVLRQTLQTALGTDGTAARRPNAGSGLRPRAVAPGLVPSAAPDLDAHEIVLPQARLPVCRGHGANRAVARQIHSLPRLIPDRARARRLNLHSGSAPGARQSRARGGNAERVSAAMTSPFTPIRRRRRFAARNRRHSPLRCLRSRRMRRCHDGASSARRHRCCDRAANPVAGRFTAGSHRRFWPEDR